MNYVTEHINKKIRLRGAIYLKHIVRILENSVIDAI